MPSSFPRAVSAETARCINGLEIRQVGMSRSGNHALQHWIMSQAQGRICFLNCAEPRTNPFWSARALDRQDRVAVASYPEFDLDAERQGRLSRKDLLLYSHEDCFLGMLSRAEAFEANHDRWLGPSARRVDVLLLRDPFNLFASRLVGGLNGGVPSAALRIWKQHAREFLGLRRHLREDRVLVNYNRWVRERAYRREVAQALGLTFSDAGRLHVPPVGAGSSFDGLSYDGAASAMGVLERWRHLAQEPAFLNLFDGEVLELAHSIFGDKCAEPLLHVRQALRN